MARTREEHWRNRKASILPTRQLVYGLAGFVLLAVSSVPFFNFPRLGVWLVPVGLIYLSVLYLVPRAWLVVLPLATVALDLTTYTGRFLYNEYDFLFLITIASGLIFDRYRINVYAPSWRLLPVGMFFFLYVLNIADWSVFLQAPESFGQNPYYMDGYSYKVGKGFLWGAALVPMWGYLMARNKRASVSALLLGLCLAAIWLLLVILWERGTLGTVLALEPWWSMVKSLLDLTSSYRVTGIFADMHTGGEVIDGVILLFLPAALYTLFLTRSPAFRALGAAAVVALAYCTLVGFTRATYAGFAIGVGLWMAFTLWNRRLLGLPLPVSPAPALIAFLCSALTAVVLYRQGGVSALVGMALTVIAGFTVPRFRAQPARLFGAGFAILAGTGLSVYAHLTSRWVDASAWVLPLIVVLSLLAAMSAAWLAQGMRSQVVSEHLVAVCALVGVPLVLALALGGYQIGDRSERIAQDLDTRLEHWARVRASSAGDIWSTLFGNGVGRFPSHFVAEHPEEVTRVGSFAVVQQGRNSVLRMGAGRDLVIGQRVSLLSYADYRVDVRLRTTEPGVLSFALCRRNLIYASDFKAPCEHQRLKFDAEDGAFQELSVVINSGDVPNKTGLSGWSTLFQIKHPKGVPIDIDHVQLSVDGFNQLRNSGFRGGMDHWYYYNDFSHLPWHVKNLFLQVWFEMGWLGLMLFVLMLILMLQRTLRAHSADSLAPVYAAGVAAVAAFGMFGSPLDSSRVAWLFSLYLLCGLVDLRQREPGRGRRPRPDPRAK